MLKQKWKLLDLLKILSENMYLYIFKFCLFLVELGLHYCAWAFFSSRQLQLLFVAVHRLLIAVASLVFSVQVFLSPWVNLILRVLFDVIENCFLDLLFRLLIASV